MTYAEECRLRAQMLLEAADGVEFQLSDGALGWADLHEPIFSEPLHLYRRKPKKVRHTAVLIWVKDGSAIDLVSSIDDQDADDYLNQHPEARELKRETVFVEVEE